METQENTVVGVKTNRNLTVGSSEVFTLSMSNFYGDKTPLENLVELWEEKKGLKGDREDNQYLAHGRIYEQAHIDWFNQVNPGLVARANKNDAGEQIRFLYSDDNFLAATPDAFYVKDGKEHILEIKDSWDLQKWSEIECPYEYYLQCQWQMGVTGRNYATLFAIVGGRWQKPYIYHLEFDDAVFLDLKQKAERFKIALEYSEFPYELYTNEMPVEVKDEALKKGISVSFDDNDDLASAVLELADLKQEKSELDKSSVKLGERIKDLQKIILTLSNGAEFIRMNNGKYLQITQVNKKAMTVKPSQYYLFTLKNNKDTY